jgi:putative transposase
MTYNKVQRDDSSLIDALNLRVQKHSSIDFWKCYYRLRRKGLTCNHKKLYRVYTMQKLNIRRRTRRRIPQRIKQPLGVPQGFNKGWSMDFMTDSLVAGRRYRLLKIMDDYNRESLAVEVDTSLSATRVIRVLERLVEFRGAPQSIRVDNGPEFISERLHGWCESSGIHLQFIQPGKPVQNAFIERKNGSMRKELLDAYQFYSWKMFGYWLKNSAWITTMKVLMKPWVLCPRLSILNPFPLNTKNNKTLNPNGPKIRGDYTSYK